MREFEIPYSSNILWPEIDEHLKPDNNSKDSLFSIVYTTIANSYDSLTCLNINSGSTSIIAGFSDSSIRKWNLNSSLSYSNNNDSIFPHILPQSIDYTINHSIPSENNMDANNFSSDDLYGHAKPVYSLSQDNLGKFILLVNT